AVRSYRGARLFLLRCAPEFCIRARCLPSASRTWWGRAMSMSEYDAALRSDPMAAPACLRCPWAWLLVFPGRRIVIDALVLTILAGICCFFRLSEGTLLGDEAAFACTTDRMRAT